jgi:TonB family protein
MAACLTRAGRLLSNHGESPRHRLAPALNGTRDKWRIRGAFGLAIFVHLVAIGFGALRDPQSAELIVGSGRGAVEVLLQTAVAMDEPVALQDFDPAVPAPPPVEEYLFAEVKSSPPPARHQVTKSVVQAPRGRTGTPSSLSALALAIKAPLPEYPSEARQNGITGDGIALMTVDRMRGSVMHVSMWKSTGNASLDDAALRSFRRWRFKPGSVSTVKAPVTFRLTAQLD